MFRYVNNFIKLNYGVHKTCGSNYLILMSFFPENFVPFFNFETPFGGSTQLKSMSEMLGNLTSFRTFWKIRFIDDR